MKNFDASTAMIDASAALAARSDGLLVGQALIERFHTANESTSARTYSAELTLDLVPAIRVFISYRHRDMTSVAQLLQRTLVDRLVAEGAARMSALEASRASLRRSTLDRSVFLDRHGIGVDEDFRVLIPRLLEQSMLVLAIVSAQWFPNDRSTTEDWVRVELEQALAFGKLIVLVEVDGTTADEQSLPSSLRRLLTAPRVPLNTANPNDCFDRITAMALKRWNDLSARVLAVHQRVLRVVGRRSYGVMLENGTYEGALNGDPALATMRNEIVRPDGLGSFLAHSGEFTSGIWLNGELSAGFLLHVDGHQYLGEVVTDPSVDGRVFRSGRGIYVHHTGCYIGEHDGGLQHGHGVYHHVDGYSYFGRYERGKRTCGIAVVDGVAREVTVGGAVFQITTHLPVPQAFVKCEIQRSFDLVESIILGRLRAED